MRKFYTPILLLLLSAIVLTSLNIPTCPKQNVNGPIAFSVGTVSCSIQQLVSNSAFVSTWFQDDHDLAMQWKFQCFIGLLSFLLIFSKYLSPLDEIYRPPCGSNLFF